MGPPLVDAVSSRSREAAIETVIDMDPNGAAHRVARTKVGTVCGIDGLWMMMCPCERANAKCIAAHSYQLLVHLTPFPRFVPLLLSSLLLLYAEC